MPTPFELPRNYHAVVMEGLEKGFLSGGAKTKFIGSIAAAIFRYKSYPTKDEYEHIGQQIIKKCSFLKSSTGTGYVSSIKLPQLTGLSCILFMGLFS